MPNSMLTGVSGLIAHQRLLDVVGHNIANVNTTGFKAQRILFADLLYETISPAAGSNQGQQGGTNPNQIGGGVKIAMTDRRFGQGALENTGEQFDFAISGEGFFTATDGSQDVYTRAGAFSLDEQGFLVAPGGFHLKRFSSAGEPDGVNPGFQIPGDPRISIPLGAPVEGTVSTKVKITGNLSADAEPPSPQSYVLATPFEIAGANAANTDLLNDLDSVTTPYVNGDQIQIEGTHANGDQVFATFGVNAGTTIQDLVNAIGAEFPEATATFSNGLIRLEANANGKSQLNVILRNAPVNADRGIAIGSHQFTVANIGINAGETNSVVTIYDAKGGAHELDVNFVKLTDDVWSMSAGIHPSEGTMISGTIDALTFSDTGNIISTGNPTISIQIKGIAVPQTITFDFGDSLAAERLTHFPTESGLSAGTDGSPPGVLSGVKVDSTGEIKGVSSNGKIFTLAQLAITSFSNPKGLVAIGENYFGLSLNSGLPEVGTAGGGGRGKILGGQLESSNVDIASEFTKLIIAQRGFSANARTITVSSQVLEELTNIIR